MRNIELFRAIKNYYQESESAYRNWGKDEEREGIYALHGGFAPEGKRLTHYEEVKELSRQLINFAQIRPSSLVLDAGCGAGALTFELADKVEKIKVIGVNIAHNQLLSAHAYRLAAGQGRVYFCEQDYHVLAFPDETFDAVIFCESYIHSPDKALLAQEVHRVLKANGSLVMSDTFLKRAPKDTEEKALLRDLMRGWYLPSILLIEEFKRILEKAGFGSLTYEEHTQNIIESSRRMRAHTQMRIREGNSGTEVIKLSRKSVIACNECLERGLTGYYFVKGEKFR